MRVLPPGQVETKLVPVVGEVGPSDAITEHKWRVTLDGRVENPLQWTLREFLALPQRDLVMDVHCVTGWTRFNTRFIGVPLADLLKRTRPHPDARFIQFISYSPRDHDTSLPFPLHELRLLADAVTS